MKKTIKLHNIEKFKSMRNAMNLEDAIKESNRCLLCEDAPCSKGCPAGTDPGKFIRQIKFENYKGAARTVRDNNIFGSVCSYICPVEKLCEKKCSVKALEDPINIGGLQRFVSEYGRDNKLEQYETNITKKEKIALVGAGPASLSCAFELAKAGYGVTIFEKEQAAGGIARWNIPDYRLPREAVEYDCKQLLDLGVDIQCDTEIASIGDAIGLLKNSYQAVFLGTGLSRPVCLPIFNGCTNVTDYFTFLHSVKAQDDKFNVKNQYIVVLGAGSVAMDSACAAAALGAKRVTVVYRRSKSEMPADVEEIALAHKLNVNFRTHSIVTEAVKDGDKITYIKGSEVEWQKIGSRNEADAKIIPGTEFGLNADLVIQALGTKADDALSQHVKCTSKGTIEVNQDFSTSVSGVFSAGDVVNAGTTIVQAVGEGKKAAANIDLFLRGGKS